MRIKSFWLFAFLLLASLGHAQLPNHDFNPNNPGNPYNLTDLDNNLVSGDYDAAGNTATDALSVTYTPPPLHLNTLSMSNGVLRLELIGPPMTCVIQVSSNLVHWLPLSTNTIPVEGSVIISDPGASNQPVRFYRAVSFAAATSNLPTLSATRLGSQLLLSWPTNFTGFTLETATNLSPTSWTSNSILPSIVNGQYTVTNAITGGTKFFRLKK